MRTIDPFGARSSMPRGYIPAREVTPEETAAVGGLPPGVATYDILYWNIATSLWTILSFTADTYKVLQHTGAGVLGYDWVRAH